MRRYTSHELRTEQREIAREMRREPTSAEALVWEQLRARRLNGLKFRRQHPVGRFIVDFYCVDAGLAIELDGSVHDDAEQRQADAVRQDFLESRDIRVLRFSNNDVRRNMEGVLGAIVAASSGNVESKLPSPRRGEGPGVR